MNSLEELSAFSKRLIEAITASAEEARKLAKAMEEQWKAYQQMYIDPMMECAIDYFNQVALINMRVTESLDEVYACIYIPRDPIPKTPYKPSFKTVIFDKRLKFPKCRSNCR